MPREVKWHGRTVTRGIFKEPVGGRVALRKLNLDGDRQADLTVHGGTYKGRVKNPTPETAVGTAARLIG
jgi:MOSC domain-containing protein YiiM